MSRRLIGVGVGPGDPELLTVRALKTIRAADLVLAPTTDLDIAGRAETIATAACGELRVVRILFEMAQGLEGIHRRRSSANRAAEQIVNEMGTWRSAAFLTIGDPNVFSTFSLLAEMVAQIDPTVRIESTPGIMAFQEVVAKAGLKLLDEEESFRLLTGLNLGSDLTSALQDPNSAVVVYKGGSNLETITQIADSAGRLESAWIGIKVGMADAEVIPLAEVDRDEVGYLSTLVFPPTSRRT